MSPSTLAPPTPDAHTLGGSAVDPVALRKRAMEILASLQRDKAEATRTASESRRGDALAKATGRSVFDRAIAEVERTLAVLDRASGIPTIDAGTLPGRVR